MANVKRTKEEVATELLRLSAEGHSMTSTSVDRTLVQSAMRYYGSWKSAIRSLGIEQTRKSYVQSDAMTRSLLERRRWSDDAIKSALKTAVDSGMTSSDFRIVNKRMADSIDRRFGGLHRACSYFGIGTLKRESIDPFIRAGHEFEDALGELFKAIGVDFGKERHGDCIPDFTVGDVWVDAKLSEWTVHTSETIRKYEPNCRELRIVFLRGDPKTDRMLTDKTRIVHVSHYINQLPRDKRGFYMRKFAEIEQRLEDEVA